MLAVAIGLILLATLIPESGRGGVGFRWRILLDPLHMTEAALNAILFTPLGGAAAALGMSASRSIALALAISTSIEILQLTAIPGRFGELQDILANTTGGAIGWLLVAALHRGRHRNAGRRDS